MKFLKYAVFVLFGFIVLSAVVSFGGAQAEASNSIVSDILDFESAVNNGQIVSDGMIKDDQNPNAKPNAIGEGVTVVGGKVTDGIASVIEMVGGMIGKIFG